MIRGDEELPDVRGAIFLFAVIVLAFIALTGCAAERVPGQRTDVSLHDARTFCAIQGLRYSKAHGWHEGDGAIATLLLEQSPVFQDGLRLTNDCMTAMGWRDL